MDSSIISRELSLFSGNVPESIYIYRPLCMIFATFSYLRPLRMDQRGHAVHGGTSLASESFSEKGNEVNLLLCAKLK